MKLSKKTKCPCCGSKEIITLGFDQFCLDCNWDNSFEQVQSGSFESQILELENEEPQNTNEDHEYLMNFSKKKK